MQELFLVVALGNPGAQYENTRHNAGWIMIDFVLEKLGLQANWQFDKKHEACIRKTTVTVDQNNKKLRGRTVEEGTYTIIFCKPQTYMNLSGKAVQSLSHFYKIPSTKILVVHDDLDQPLGEIKYKKQGGSGGQNGIKNISEKLGSDQYFRLKIGIGRPQDPRFTIIDWVLHPFSVQEREILYNLKDKCIHTIGLFLQGKV